MAHYEVYLHFDLLDNVPTQGEQRRMIMNFVRSLADQPHAPGDFTDPDQNQRRRQIKIIGDGLRVGEFYRSGLEHHSRPATSERKASGRG